MAQQQQQQQPGTPTAPAAGPSIFGGAGQAQPTPHALMPAFSTALTPASASSNNTYIMPNSPLKNRAPMDGYRPKVTRTLGQRPACLVNASVTYCGNNQIYAFGGFDQYTDEVYNHVLRLDLVSHQWTLVDNYGDIPGVRMGHTATLYKGDKLLVFGGENEHRTYLSDLIIFDLKTAHWTQPAVTGPIPKGRARHAAVLHEDKLFIVGGITGHDNYVLDDICYLDLKTYTWSRSWRFVGRFDHSAYIWGERVWVFGGLSEDMDKVSDLWWLDLKGNPAFDSPPHIGTLDRSGLARSATSPRPSHQASQSPAVGSSGYAANSRTPQVNTPSFHLKAYAPPAPGAVSALKFVGGVNLPSQMQGIHFHVYSSGTLLDFVTPAATITSKECSLSALDLGALRWQKLAEGREIFKPGYRWHYCTMNEDGTKAWLLGCPTEGGAIDLGANGLEEYLSDIMEIDLRRYGFLGSNMSSEARIDLVRPSLRTRHVEPPSKGLGADLAKLFNQPPETGSGTDFVVTALSRDYDEEEIMGSALMHSDSDEGSQTWLAPDAPTSHPIHVHRLILQARWPHFARLWASQMAEFHTKKMHIPEPYSVVKAFLYYLYTDRIDPAEDDMTDAAGAGATADLADLAGLLVMSNIYNIPHLRLLCVNRLSKELDVDHACVIWYCAGLASEEWLRKRAACFCMTHWGRVVRTGGFQRLPRNALVELSQEVDMEGRVVGGDELDMMAGMDGGRFGDGGSAGGSRRKESVSSSQTQLLETEDDDDEDGMEMS
ncbi:30e5e4f2-6b11-43d7-af86-0ec6aae4fe8f [Staphylotrichum tortipilum]|uniref:30e5e4f2-6b11-43d7-af86-0ec6aae4fe8f n=1 Tax=Staphylotrichum tortipilum TaxID=2831512 RepID=A0AAN6ML78_9PEZI|nr:30e5e4f2-6b11-43d7-af86-0ec6aae4fe8f [Staphylotrichum longicolle]